MDPCPIFPSECMEAAQWDYYSVQKLERSYKDFNRSQLSREWRRCIILDRVWHFTSVCLCVLLPSGNRSAFSAQILQLKRLKLTWISLSVTMASCSAVLPTESRWHLSGTSTCINALSSYPSGSHTVITWCCSRVFCFTNSKRESIVFHSQFIVRLVKYTGQICFVYQLQCVRWCGKLECIFSRKESRSRVAGLPSLFTTLRLLSVSLSQFQNLDSIFEPQWFPCCLFPD